MYPAGCYTGAILLSYLCLVTLSVEIDVVVQIVTIVKITKTCELKRFDKMLLYLSSIV